MGQAVLVEREKKFLDRRDSHKLREFECFIRPVGFASLSSFLGEVFTRKVLSHSLT